MTRSKLLPTMLLYGLCSGSFIISSLVLTFLTQKDGAEKTGRFSELLGYLIMLVALSVIFMAIKRYRDRELGGVIAFSTAFLLGLGISAIAGLIYVVGWEAYLGLSGFDFIGSYTQAQIEAKEAAGLSGDELQTFIASMETMKERYASRLFRMPMTFLEIFPVGLLVSLLSAGLLRNRKFLPNHKGTSPAA